MKPLDVTAQQIPHSAEAPTKCASHPEQVRQRRTSRRICGCLPQSPKSSRGQDSSSVGDQAAGRSPTHLSVSRPASLRITADWLILASPRDSQIRSASRPAMCNPLLLLPAASQFPLGWRSLSLRSSPAASPSAPTTTAPVTTRPPAYKETGATAVVSARPIRRAAAGSPPIPPTAC